MQIHELNNFTGTLGSGAYLAIDNGTDTGKISSQGLLAATEARIDNIIAGDAPSAAEVTDARYGADGVTYSSLGTAIRTQFTDVKSALNDTGLKPIKNLVKAMVGGKSTNNTVAGYAVSISDNASRAYAVIDVEGGHFYSINQAASNNFSGFAYTNGANDYWIGQINNYKVDNIDYVFQAPLNANKLYLCNTGWTGAQGLVVMESKVSIIGKTISDYPFNTVIEVATQYPISPYANAAIETAFLSRQFDGQGVVFGGDLPTFSGNTSQSDALLVSIPRIYYKQKGNSGDWFASSDALKNLSFSIGHNQLLLFDYDTLTAYVTDSVSIVSYPMENKVMLLWKQGTAVKGLWSWIYYDNTIKKIIRQTAPYKIKTLRSVAHQGYSPTNYMGYCKAGSYKNAADYGFDYGECDIRFSSDNVPMCTHDASFVDATSGDTIVIADHTASELQTFDYYGGTIATFDDVVRTCKANGLGLYIDHLAGGWSQALWDSLFQVVTKYGMERYVAWLLTGNDADAVSKILAFDKCAEIIPVIYFTDVATAVNIAESIKTEFNKVSLDVNYTTLTLDDIVLLNNSLPIGCSVEIWTLDSQLTYYDYVPYVSAITSNKFCPNIMMA